MSSNHSATEKRVRRTDELKADPSRSPSQSTIAQIEKRDEKSEKDIELHGGEGESAIPEDRRFEALERINRVTWQHDPVNPRNWSFWKKWRCAGIVRSSFGLLILATVTGTKISMFVRFHSIHLFRQCPSSMMAPALPQISDHYNISNVSLLNMTLTIFLLAYALGPLVLSPMSEIWGRKWVRLISYFTFI